LSRPTGPSGFFREASDLLCDGVPLAAVAAAEGTPLYVYSAAVFRERYRALDDAFGDYPHALHYALKANSTLAIARLLRDLGSHADANSIWEIDIARKAGFPPSSIVFTGVGKSATELECAVGLGVKAINVESAGELARVEAIADRLGRTARVAVRVNPDVDAKSHPHISTGLKINKFGLPIDAARELLDTITQRDALRLVAIHVHIGSQITSLEPLQRAAHLAAELSGHLIGRGIPLEYIDLGGGLGVSYDDREVPSPREYVDALLNHVRPTGLPVVVEPGRTIAAPAGVLLASVVDVKPRTDSSEFVIIDAGMTELLRPALYDAFHRIEPVTIAGGETAGADLRHYEIVGPVCESSDVVGRNRRLPPLEVGDVVAIRDTGAYGAVMASNYNRRPLPAEVLVDDGSWRVIRRRQTVEDLLSLEVDS
jgi:diaminopimelate decarboxylase